MRNSILIVISSLQIGNFAHSQNSPSINDILETINLREYPFDLESERIDHETYPFGILEIELIEDYSIYYIIELQLIDLEISMGVQSGFKLILYSHSLSQGLLLSFTRSHSVHHDRNDYYVLDFNTSERLILPEKKIVDQSLYMLDSLRISYIDDIPSDTFTIFTFHDTTEYYFSVPKNYCDIELNALFKAIDSKSSD